jgi:U3 small nucleolar RNA-associated protein 11
MISKKGPTSGKSSNGTVAGDRGNQVLSQEAVRLFKTQDLGYVRTMRNKARKEVEELAERVLGITGNGRKVLFVDDEEEQTEKVGDADQNIEFDTEDEDDQDDEMNLDKEARKLQNMRRKEAEKLESKLSAARQRLKVLTEAEEALDLQRAKMAKSPSVGGVNKQGVKFKVRERKR